MGKWHYRYGGEVTEPVREINPDTGEITVPKICGRCGGAGGSDKWHHTGWTCYQCGGARTLGTETIKVYTLEKIAKLEKTAEKRRATAQAKREAKEAAAAAERAANLNANQETNREKYPEAVKILGRDDLDGDFLKEMVKKHSEGYEFTPKQAAAIRKSFGKLVLKRHRNRLIDAWEKLNGTVPRGRHEVKAALLTVKIYDDRYSYSPHAVTYKALWLTDQGYKIFGSLPSGVRISDEGDWVQFKRGEVHTFRATLEPSKDDPKFGFYKRPYMKD
jgi:hypothetical protein